MKLAAPCLGLSLLALPVLRAAEPAPAWTAKIDPRVLDTAAQQPDGMADYLLILKEQADLSSAESLRTKEEKGALVFALLNEVAQRTQPAVQRALRTQGAATVESFWVANMIRVRGPVASVIAMAARTDVARIDPNPEVALKLPPQDDVRVPNAINAIEPGITLIKATDAWARGFTGQGIVVGGTDTGYRWTHAVLKNKYRGWNGTTADHNYNWHDAIHSGGGSCGANATQPCDDQGHGTHTMGTMVGSDGGTNQTGVAPGAKWIGCRNMNVGVGTPATYSECLQWFIAPTDALGLNPDPSKAPDVINNSWGCPVGEGCAANTLKTAIENVRAAGIVVVVSAGNDGLGGCSTVSDPPAIYDAAFCVGATNGDLITNFSSRGPVTVDGSNRLKPNVTAPGYRVRSATKTSDTAYATLDGTSMSGPHVAGAVALLLSAHPELRGKPTAVQTLFEQSAFRLTGSQICGGVAGTAIPNNTFGWGRIDALGAMGLDDTDGDGMADWQELLAGTSRTDGLSVLRVTNVDRSGNSVTISFPTIVAKRYRIERADNLVAPVWAAVGTDFTGTGSAMQAVDAGASAERMFYRVVVVQ